MTSSAGCAWSEKSSPDGALDAKPSGKGQNKVVSMDPRLCDLRRHGTDVVLLHQLARQTLEHGGLHILGGRIAPQVARFVGIILEVVQLAPVSTTIYRQTIAVGNQGAGAYGLVEAQVGALAIFFYHDSVEIITLAFHHGQ